MLSPLLWSSAFTTLGVYGTPLQSRATNSSRSLTIPSAPPEGRQVVDANFQSYSIEFSYMLDFAGNNSNPNKFSYQLIQNLGDISGAYPIIRSGGSTQNRATYVPSQKEALIATFSTPGADQPSALTIGPTWHESFQQFPKGTQYIYGLNFYDGEAGLNQTVLEAGPAFRAIGEDLYAFEIGNEVDGWPGGSRRPANWTVKSYVDQWNQFAEAVEKEVLGGSELEPLFQGCAFEAPRNIRPGNTSIWNIESAVRLGINSQGKAKTVSDHDYMGSNCASSTIIPTIEANILNHTHMTELMWYHDYLSNFSVANGVPYVIGETNSISCQGKANVSDVFAAAIWSIDYVLYGATLQVSRMYFHMGTQYRYSPWQPITLNGTAPYVKPLYYGNLFTSTALAGGNKQVDILVNETFFTAYAVYDAGTNETASASAPKPESVVLVNLNIFNATQHSTQRPYVEVELPTTGNADWANAEVRRLTAPGVDVKTGITFAGQAVSDETGEITGDEVVEAVKDGKVLVGAGEAVLVSLK